MTFQHVSEHVQNRLVTGAMLLHRFPKMISMFRGRRSTLNVSILLLRGSAALQTCALACFFANRIVRAASSGDNVQIAWQALDIVRMPFSVAATIFGANPLRVECQTA